jgi:anti-sigma factor RsiW
MNCNEIRETMPDLAVGGMKPSAAMIEHLETCAACSTQLQEFRQTMALLDEWPVPEPSPYFDMRLQARLREEKAAESVRSSRWFGWLPRPTLAMAAALLVAIGVGVVSLNHTTTESGPKVAIQAPTVDNATLQRGTAVADLQTLESDDDLYANFDVLDEIDSHQAQSTSDN